MKAAFASDVEQDGDADAMHRAEGSQISFYLHPKEAWDAMYDDCTRATQSIEFDQYIIQNDAVGQRFMALFADKSRAGLKVHLLLDTIGSRGVLRSPYIAQIRQAGGKVHFYNRMHWRNVFTPWKWFPRNHAKTMLIDSDIAFIGSVCIDSEMAGWRDTHMRCAGKLVDDIERDFDRRWARIEGKKFRLKDYFTETKGKFRYLVNHPALHTNPIYRELLKQIKGAKSSIFIATPYFIPPWRLRQAMKRAASHGVEVRVMMSQHSDVPIADHVSHSYFSRLLKKGIRIFLYRDTVMHAKFSVVDNNWATVGSTNIDYLSLWRNREANVVITDRDTVATLKGHFTDDLGHCLEADLAYCRARPLSHRIMGIMGRLIKRFL